jgi:AcrR family transcriptional regulator
MPGAEEIMATRSAAVAAAPTARGRLRRAQILDAALGLFADRGYNAVSLRDIAAASGITHPGLLRHFQTKPDILEAVIEDVEARTGVRWSALPAGERRAAVIQRWNEEDPARAGLIAMLAGEAGPDGHPAHDRIAARYRRVRALTIAEYRAREARGELLPGVDIMDAAVELLAGWDGLGLIAHYLPIDIGAALELRERQLSEAPTGVRHPASAVELPDLTAAVDPQDLGSIRRDQIVADAMALFAERGYLATTMQDIADRVGVSKAALFHHYPSKTDLLTAVLAARDAEIGQIGRARPLATAAGALRDAVAGARRNAAERPGLIEIYAVLSCEAAASSHPAHAYFAARFARVIDFFTALFRAAAAEGSLRPGLDPDAEARWFVALWDGLQFQWMYDPEDISIDEHLSAHLDRVLVEGH